MTIESQISDLLKKINLPFCGKLIDKFYVSPYVNITISGIGPVFYRDAASKRIYTILQRRYKDNFQWWFPGGYVELPSASADNVLQDIDADESRKKIKNATIDEMYHNALNNKGAWQKAKKEINDAKFLQKSFEKHGVNWPKNIDANWQTAWQREVLEETGIDLEKFENRITLDFKFNQTFMIGAERDRLTNIDGKFCAFLGDLDKAPKTMPDAETEELKWIALDEIYFDEKEKNFMAHDKIVNLYTASLIEEALHEIICFKIKQISQVKNEVSGQETARFNCPQNLQHYLLEKINVAKLDNFLQLKRFLAWKFGELEISQNLCGKDGGWFYDACLKIGEFLKERNFDERNLITLEKNLTH